MTFSSTWGPKKWIQLKPKGRVRRGRVWTLETPYRELEIYLSDGGKSLRVWDCTEQRELK